MSPGPSSPGEQLNLEYQPPHDAAPTASQISRRPYALVQGHEHVDKAHAQGEPLRRKALLPERMAGDTVLLAKRPATLELHPPENLLQKIRAKS
mmetsp:Transcript_68952/g.152054  ORF Transcript_68952/g.152054 Transcript_68952/m.152054 type:complete len:94 (-) Transcript_68952:466-747(-)